MGSLQLMPGMHGGQNENLDRRASRARFRAPKSTQSVVTKPAEEAFASHGETAGLMID